MWTMTDPKSTRTQCDAAVPSRPIGLGLLVAEAADDPVGDRRQLALRAARADHEVVGHRGQAGQIEQHDVGGLLVLGQLDDPPGEVERRSLRRPARPWRAGAGRRRAARSRDRRASRRAWRVRSRSWGPPCGLVEPMVADVGRDRIRDEVAQRPSGRRAGTQLAGRQAQPRPVEERRPIGEVGQVRRRGSPGPASG